MQFLLDHLTSTLVGSVVLLIVVGVGARMGESEMDTQLYESSRRISQAFAQQLEGDLLNVGYGVPGGTAPILDWTDSTFVFLRKVDTTAASPVVEITYRRVTVDSVEVRGETVGLYEVERLVDGARLGGSPPIVTGYRLDLLLANGQPTTVPAAARALAVTFRTTYGGSTADHTGGAARFDRTFYPANLTD